MTLKSFYLFLFLAAVFRKAISACTRMQRRVNRSHTSFNTSKVKRPGIDY
ncbi:hypothetical protein FIU92_04070 [Ruegeria sp. THAF33]|jgi:hypothetical protein|nr:hypothetical protein FIU92_04070 [Ruegeria sp. THAF33]